MKYIISIIVTTVLLFVAVSCNKLGNTQQPNPTNKKAKNEIPTDSLVQSLPQTAQEFLTESLAEKEVARVSADKGNYIVWLTTGEKLEFDLQGKLKEIEAPGGVSDTIVDERIVRDVKALNPKISIIRLENTGYGYVVKLSNGSEVKYDLNCQRMDAEYD